MSQLSCSGFSGGIIISPEAVLGTVSCWCFLLVRFSLSPFVSLGFSLLLFDSSLSSKGLFLMSPLWRESPLSAVPQGVPALLPSPWAQFLQGVWVWVTYSCSPQGCSYSMGPSEMSPHWHGCSQPQPLRFWLPKPELRMMSVQGVWSSWLL